MVIAEPRLETADERLVGEQRVEIGGRLGDANALDLGRDTAVKIGQRFTVIQPFGLGHEALDEMQDARSEEHTSELQSLMRISYAVFCFKKKNRQKDKNTRTKHE